MKRRGRHDDGGPKGSGSAKKRCEQTKCIRISLASVKTSDVAPSEIFLANLPPRSSSAGATHRAVDTSQLTESSRVIDRRTGQARGARALKRAILNLPAEKSVLITGKKGNLTHD